MWVTAAERQAEELARLAQEARQAENKFIVFVIICVCVSLFIFALGVYLWVKGTDNEYIPMIWIGAIMTLSIFGAIIASTQVNNIYANRRFYEEQEHLQLKKEEQEENE